MPAESALSLVERLRAALDRAEEIARAVNSDDEWWTREDLETHVEEHDAALIVANGPAHVLRTVAAHRKILDRHRAQDDEVAHRLGLNGIPPWCNGCGATSPCPDVRALAAIYFPEAPDA